MHPLRSSWDVLNYLAIAVWLGAPQLAPFDGKEAGVTRWLVFVTGVAVLFLIAGVRQDQQIGRLMAVAQPSDIDRVSELVIEARALRDQTKSGNVAPSIQEPTTKSFKEKAAAVILDVSPQHMKLLDHLQVFGYFVPGDNEPRYEHLRQVAIAENTLYALQEIERRLRAHAGEDIGALSTKRALLGDLLLGAHHEVERLHHIEAPTEEFRQWVSELSKLLRLALHDPEVDKMMDTSRYKPGRMRSGELDDEAIAIRTVIGSNCWSCQSRLDEVSLRESFDPRDWHGRWT